MSDRERPIPKTPEDWAAMRAAYEAGESEASLAKRYKVDRKTIRARRRREGWVPHVSAQVGKAEAATITERAHAKVIDMATRQAVDTMAADGTLEALVDDVREGVLRHADIERGLLDLAAKTVNRLLGRDGAPPLRAGEKSSEASEIKDAVAAIAATISLSREIAGRKPGTPSVAVEADESRRIDEVVLVVRERQKTA